MADNIIERIILKSLYTEEVAFIGTTLQCMAIKSAPYTPTAEIMFNKNIKQFELIINEEWFSSLPSDDQRVAVFVHELNHIFFKHVFVPPEIMMSKNKTKINISMDLVINQLIRNLPEICFTIEKLKDKNKKKFPSGLTFNEYYDLLDDATIEVPDCSGVPEDHDSFQKGAGQGSQGKQESKDSGEESEGEGKEKEQKADDGKHTGHNCDGTCKGHDGQKKPGKKGTREVKVSDYYEEHPFDKHGWDEAEAQDAMEATRDLIKRSMQKASMSHTNVPRHIKDILEEIDANLAKINYKELLMKALKQSLPSKDIRKTWKRPSRRLGDLAKGNMSSLMPKLEAHLDTSGSISIIEANEFLALTNNFMTVGVSKADLYLWHTDIYHHEKIKKNFKIAPDKFQSGGTDLNPSIAHIHKKKPDLAIIVTDGYVGEVNIPKGFCTPLVVVISKQGDENHPLKKYPFVTTVKMS